METLAALNLLLSPHFTFFDGSRSLPSPPLPVWSTRHPFFYVQLSPSGIEKSLIFFLLWPVLKPGKLAVPFLSFTVGVSVSFQYLDVPEQAGRRAPA